MLYATDFLQALDKSKEKTLYARVIKLDKNELPLGEITGQVTSGSINLDGNSAVRRSCSLSLINPTGNLVNYDWALSTRFKLEIGLKNTVSNISFYPNYPEIIWFKMGTYILTSFNNNLATNNSTISLQGKDKMCLLNGDVGGNINATTNFGEQEFYDKETNITITEKLKIKDIIREAVHAYAGEPFHNIIINDIDDMGLELLEYRGDQPLYLIKNLDTNQYEQMTFNGDLLVRIDSNTTKKLANIQYLNDYSLLNNNSYDKFLPEDLLTEDANLELASGEQFIIYFEGGGSLRSSVYKQLDSTNHHISFVKTDAVQRTMTSGRYYFNNSNNLSSFTFSQVLKPNTIYKFDISSTLSISKVFSYNYGAEKITYGTTVGYHACDLIYAGQLVANPGETLTSVLDKIKNMLGEFEYFYNLDGQFVFQRKRSYINTVWSPMKTTLTEEGYFDTSVANSNVAYEFNNTEFFTSVANAPAIANLKNDFTVWGERQGVGGGKIPIHMRYAIDKKPTQYTLYDYDITLYSQEANTTNISNPIIVDWRELLYRMALDYRKHNHDDNFEYQLEQRNPWCIFGKTGYEQYYTDIEGFWRELYDYPLAALSEEKQQYFTSVKYADIKDINITQETNLYMKGIFKPICEKVKMILANEIPNFPTVYNEETITTNNGSFTIYRYGNDTTWYLKINDTDKYARIESATNIKYAYSLASGHRDKNGFQLGNYIDGKTWTTHYLASMHNYIKNGTLFELKNVPISQVYVYDNSSNKKKFYNFVDSIDLTNINNSYKFYKKTFDENGKEKYERITNNQGKSMTTNQKLSLYASKNEKKYIPITDFIWSRMCSTKAQELSAFTQYYYYDNTNIYNIKDEIYEYSDNYVKSLFTSSKSPEKITAQLTNDMASNIDNAIVSFTPKYYQYKSNYNDSSMGQYAYWNKILLSSSAQLNFWIDFLNTGTLNEKYNTQEIGDRPKVVKETTVKSIYYRDTPKIIFYPNVKGRPAQFLNKGYSLIGVPEIYNYFTISSQGVAAKNRIDELLYNHSYCTESVTINSIPIYYLEPNSRIRINDEQTGIHGEYVVSKLSFSLAYNGMMNINATKAPNNSIIKRQI